MKAKPLPEIGEEDINRFKSKIVVRGPDDCHEWSDSTAPDGYGRMRIGGRTVLAHRVAHFLATGEEPEAVCHTCDNRSCCNPAHLWSGTKALNNRDMVNKGRHARLSGAEHGRAKLTEDQVREIRRRFYTERVPKRRLARMFGVTDTLVRFILSRKRWRNVS